MIASGVIVAIGYLAVGVTLFALLATGIPPLVRWLIPDEAEYDGPEPFSHVRIVEPCAPAFDWQADEAEVA